MEQHSENVGALQKALEENRQCDARNLVQSLPVAEWELALKNAVAANNEAIENGASLPRLAIQEEDGSRLRLPKGSKIITASSEQSGPEISMIRTADLSSSIVYTDSPIHCSSK